MTFLSHFQCLAVRKRERERERERESFSFFFDSRFFTSPCWILQPRIGSNGEYKAIGIREKCIRPGRATRDWLHPRRSEEISAANAVTERVLRTTPGYGPLALNSFDVGAYRKAFGEACWLMLANPFNQPLTFIACWFWWSIKRSSTCAHSVRLIDQRGSVNKDFSCQLNLRQCCSHIQKWAGLVDELLVKPVWLMLANPFNQPLTFMLILMKHQNKPHLCPFGQTHRPKRQRKQRFQLPTELAAVLQPHSKVSRVGGRAFGEACLIDVGQSIQSTFDIHVDFDEASK